MIKLLIPVILALALAGCGVNPNSLCHRVTSFKLGQEVTLSAQSYERFVVLDKYKRKKSCMYLLRFKDGDLHWVYHAELKAPR